MTGFKVAILCLSYKVGRKLKHVEHGFDKQFNTIDMGSVRLSSINEAALFGQVFWALFKHRIPTGNLYKIETDRMG